MEIFILPLQIWEENLTVTRMQQSIAPPERYSVARRFHESLMRSQWLDAPRLAAYQESQLQQMLRHAASEVPYYGEPLSRLRRADGTFDLARWDELPIISRSDVAANWDAFQPRNLPPGHEGIISVTTSGSEGKSLEIRKTRFEHTGVACASFRYADWFSYDYKIPLAMIRAGFIRLSGPDDPEDGLWGPPWLDASTRGARHRLTINASIDDQIDWLAGLGRVYLNTPPSKAMAIAQRCEERGDKLQIAAIMTVGERLSPDVRDEVLRILGCKISDVYATAESGLIAIECPETGAYHLQSEISKVEVIANDGHSCRPGETGHLVATSLYNFAMPLIRYRFNDLVTLGGSCSCGRSLPVISKIHGRESGFFKFPDGRNLLPEFSTARIRDITGESSWQVLQTTPTAVEVRLKSDSRLSAGQHQAMSQYIKETLGPAISVQIKNVSQFTTTAGGKFYPAMRTF
jgi:phenylacetate-CoA ligase